MQLRFLQLSDIEGGVYQEDEATWSIDNVTVTLWSNQSQSALIVSEHFCNDDVLYVNSTYDLYLWQFV